MQEVKYFYLKNCPHCKRADAMIAALIQKHPELAAVPVRKIEEREQSALADAHNYYYVPCFFVGSEKLCEGVPSEEKILAVFQKALKS